MTKLNITKKFLQQARSGEPVYITDVRKAYSSLEKEYSQSLLCILNLFNNEARFFSIHIPRFNYLSGEQIAFVKSYVWAEIYNILSTLGGFNMEIYVDKKNRDLLELAKELDYTFDINKKRSDREGYGRCINVIDRMIATLYPVKSDKSMSGFKFIIKDKADMRKVPEKLTNNCCNVNIFKKVTEDLDNKVICGMDIGGTSIKTVIVVNGRISCIKKYNWFPASFIVPEQQINPICMLIRLTRAWASLDVNTSLPSKQKKILLKKMSKAMEDEASYQLIKNTVEKVEKVLKEELIEIDAIGVSFPDVVVRDKIVGGEVYKTRGMRNNPDIDYEEEYLKLTHLDKYLLKLCKKDGVVKIINDGNMAAFTAAVEMAADEDAESIKEGIFVHTLGTEFGTGWVNRAGKIPEIPLECYNLIIDLGSFIEKKYHSDDLRSINNFNTGLAGTIQKYISQSAVYRLALKYFPERRPDLYQELKDLGFLVEKEKNGQKMVLVPTEPYDMRKDLLMHLMSLPEREKDKVTEGIFKEIGEYLAVTWCETQRILQPGTKLRMLFGGLIANKYCFKMMQEGAKNKQKDMQLMAANGCIANTALMKQLEANPKFSVAQFAQAVGAVYYGNKGLIEKDS